MTLLTLVDVLKMFEMLFWKETQDCRIQQTIVSSRGRLESARNSLPPLYRDTFFQPFVEQLDKIGESGFTAILTADIAREREAGLMLDIAHVILQNSEGYNWIATDSFQEIVSDLYDGFLSAGRTGEV